MPGSIAAGLRAPTQRSAVPALLFLDLAAHLLHVRAHLVHRAGHLVELSLHAFDLRGRAVALLLAGPHVLCDLALQGGDGLRPTFVAELLPEFGGHSQCADDLLQPRPLLLEDALGLVLLAFQGHLVQVNGALDDVCGVASLALQQPVHGDAQDLQTPAHVVALVRLRRSAIALALTLLHIAVPLARRNLAGKLADRPGPLRAPEVGPKLGRKPEDLGKLGAVGRPTTQFSGLLSAAFEVQLALMNGKLQKLGGIVALSLAQRRHGEPHDLELLERNLALSPRGTVPLRTISLASGPHVALADPLGDLRQSLGFLSGAEFPQGPDTAFEPFDDGDVALLRGCSLALGGPLALNLLIAQLTLALLELLALSVQAHDLTLELSRELLSFPPGSALSLGLARLRGPAGLADELLDALALRPGLFPLSRDDGGDGKRRGGRGNDHASADHERFS